MRLRFFVGIGLMLVLVSLGVGKRPLVAQTSCDEALGQTERHTYNAQIIQTQMYYSVYLPRCYGSSDLYYPVLYLMHGSNEDDNHWLRLGLAETLDAAISSGDLPPMIVVLPFGNWIANENRFGVGSWGDIFLNHLMPLVENTYRVDGDSSKRAIGGISRGGFWAFHIAMQNPLLFTAVGGHSAFFDRYHAAAQNNPLDLALSTTELETLRVWLDRGANDYAMEGLDLMHERLVARGLVHDYTVHSTGEHDNTYWAQHLDEYLEFYATDWKISEEPHEPPVTSPTPTNDPTRGIYLLLPVVAFPSLQANISADRLHSIRAGLLDSALVLSEEVANLLTASDVSLPPGTSVVPEDELDNALWRDYSLFTLMPFDQLTPRFRVLNVDELHPLDGDLDHYPFAFTNATANYHPERLTRFLLSGVTALTRNTRKALDDNGVQWAVEAVAPYVSRADFFHISNEVSIYPTCPETTGPRLGGTVYSFCSKVEHFEVLTSLGVDIVELSGNHNNDYGYTAYRETLSWYTEHAIATVGGGDTPESAQSPLVIIHNGNRIAMLSCNWAGPDFAIAGYDARVRGGVRPGAAYCDTNWLSDLLPLLSAENDLVVITVQYAEHDQYVPTQRQENDFRFLASLGADVVLGTQAHFPQTFEFVDREGDDEAFIHYGLGNLFFDQQFFGGVRHFMDQLFIYEGRLLTVDLFTGIIEGQGRPRPMTPEERENFLYLILLDYGDLWLD